MHKHIRHLTITFTAVLMLAAAVSTASARNLSVSSQGIRIVWTPLTINGEGLAEARCNVTLEGSFHYRTIPKVERLLIGFITRAIVARPCARHTAWAFNGTERNEALGNTTLPNSLPWHLTYERFAGTLPAISSVTLLLLGAKFLVRLPTVIGNLLCQYTTSVANGNAAGIGILTAGTVTALRADETKAITSETGGCPRDRFIGEGTATVLNSSTRITVTLI